MKDAAAQTVRLADYTPFPYLVDDVHLSFRLAPSATRVISRIAFRPDPGGRGAGMLRLDGEGLRLISARIDGTDVVPETTRTGIACPAPNTPFVWEAEVEIDPEANTALSGLYLSNGIYCTQCEAEGFRRITYYPDRPDVMAPFTVRIEGDAPVMLSNGNPGAQGEGFAEWHDPWPKPSYLFALVAGDLAAHSGRFTTAARREVALNVWVRPGDEGKAGYALDALVRAMRWDETEYGREYDLDVFNIVAVDDFNMGAMENKGLNIFNSKYVLASPETATDRDFALIEGIVAHEYFHNWTGNRVTCRDWFQLCLKEGLTVFRDQQFSGDMRSPAVKRIESVQTLRARQFREDGGPLAHPVRPESYIEINNFYTATVYEKGAEVIGMLRRLVGADAYRRALDLYFARHDGDAATIEDWLKVFEDATGRDLTQFQRWYGQAGTPHLKVSGGWHDGRYRLTFAQTTPETPGHAAKEPQVLPIAVGLLDAGTGEEIVPTTMLEMTAAEQSFDLLPASGEPGRPAIPSLLRGFSAPVILEREASFADRLTLLAHDTDPFNKWEAGRSLAKDVLIGMIVDQAPAEPAHTDALARMAGDATLDPAFRALTLGLPSDDDVAQTLAGGGAVPDPMAIHAARERLQDAIARDLQDTLDRLYETMKPEGPYSPDATDAGLRALRNTALGYLSRRDAGDLARAQFAGADNMTDELAALGALLRIGAGSDEVARFHDRWSGDRLVMDKWFAMQVSHAAPEAAASTARALTEHPAFDWKNPNRFRAVLGALGANHAGFHHADGAAYELMADWLIRLDPLNPQTAARMSAAFETWPRYDADRQAMIRATLERIAATDGLSRDSGEMIARMLG